MTLSILHFRSRSQPPRLSLETGKSLSISNTMPDSRYLPEQAATLPEFGYVVMKVCGGGALPGPILDSLNFAAQTRALAGGNQGQYLTVSPAEAAKRSFSASPIYKATGPSAFVVKPFIFIQHCDDARFRMSLVFHVESGEAAGARLGRYIYHLPTAISATEFASPAPAQIAAFQSEISHGAEILAELQRKDMAGGLRSTGRKVDFGSLYLIGNKIGGMGTHTMPEELHFKSVELVEETDTYVTVRMKGNLQGGMAFGGVHRIDKNLAHTLRPAAG